MKNSESVDKVLLLPRDYITERKGNLITLVCRINRTPNMVKLEAPKKFERTPKKVA